ncbi:MAG: hypothetical protein JRJ85_02015 [Deltaproteobacteria bacterium]|nr:hypothetical protein [Deltaproteobacteria bacterium]
MKQLKKDLKEVSKALIQLTRKTEQMAKRLDSLEKARTTKAKPAKKVVAKKKAVAKKEVVRRAKEPTAIGSVLKIIKASKKGVDTATLKKKTGFDEKKVYNCIFILKRKGMVKSAQKGIYVKV